MFVKYSVRGALVVALVLLMTSVGAAQGTPGAPNGLTARAVSGSVQLAWQPVSGADSYRVLRSTSPTGAGSPVPGGDVAGTSFTDTGTPNGSSFYYTVQAIDGGTPSASSVVAGATPRGASCSSGNAVVVENCFPGSTAWNFQASMAASGPGNNAGIEGFATKTSVDAGDPLDLKINSGVSGVPYDLEIYRTGYYGGSQGRLVGSIHGLTGVKQSACLNGAGNTGLKQCSNWSVSATVTTGANWPSGVYIAKVWRPDTGRGNQILFVVRNDGGPQRVLYSIPDNTYQAYNLYGGKSVYPNGSTATATVAGDGRAVKVSFDRPYQQPASLRTDFYTFTDLSAVTWLERQGYSIAYNSSVDLDSVRPDVANPDLRAIMLGSHHEYWSAGMRANLTAARDAGVSIASIGANQIYWKIRYEDSGRTLVTYKTTDTGVQDPTGTDTGTWRDPQGANQPENALLGSMYIGDNTTYFPLRVPQAQGQHPIWRYTSAATLQSGQTLSMGPSLVGWEWDARVANGREPAGVQTVTSSAVNGLLLQDAGKVYAPGNAVVQSTIYTAASGAIVFNASTNFWARGLALNSKGEGTVRPEMQQATTNLLADMGVSPTTATGVVLDPSGSPTVQTTSPLDGASDVAVDTNVTADFSRAMDPATITTSSFTLRQGASAPVAATVTWNGANSRAVLDPAQPLQAGATYTATLTSAAEDAGGQPLQANVSWSFTTRSTSLTTRTPAPNATNVTPDTDVTATFDADMAAATITDSSFTLTPAGGSAVAAAVSYSAATRTATLDPSAALEPGTVYTARLSTAITSSGGTPLPAAITWSFTTRAAFTVTAREPAALASNVATNAAVRATFVRDADPGSLTGSTFTLTGPSGAVAATVSYDAATDRATLQPTAALALMTTYTAQLAASVRASDGQTLGSPVSWTFTTAAAAPEAPVVTNVSPDSGATGVARDANVSATFDRALDPASITGTSVSVRPTGGGTAVAAALAYDGTTRTITLDPSAALSASTTYDVRITTAVRGTDGTPLSSDVTWSFSTLDCPCRLMDGLTPVSVGNSTRDGRTGAGPWTYELGTRITVDSAVDLLAVRYWRDAAETGSHRARLWSSTGVVLAEANYTGESGSGWQRVAFSQPVALQAGATYVVSTNFNTTFALTKTGLQTPLVNGPLRSAAQPNGVYGASAGTFPTLTSKTSNYFVDAEVANAGAPVSSPAVSSTTPASGASGVAAGITVQGTFTKALQASTVTTSSFTLRDAGGASVPATVSYDSATRTARLAPTSALTQGTAYTARLTTAIRSTDNLPLLEDYTWSFTVIGGAPQVSSTSPSGGAEGVSWATDVRATFTTRLDPATVSNSTVTLSPPAGGPVGATVTYDDPTRTVRLVPSSTLTPGTVYTANITTGVRSNDDVALDTAVTWSFTTSTCPCSLFAPTLTPVSTNLATRDGRPNPGPWSRELGVKIEVSSPAQLSAVRYYKSSLETGTHTARVWTAGGSLLASAQFSNDGGGAGWKQQALATPIDLLPGQVYVVSVGFNAYYSATQFGLQTPAVNGPLHSSAVATNGVFSDASGQFPATSYRSSNYFVDMVVQ